ncbi:MAG TPA: GvpL/GvpF family gas vesicle protein [Solirubrobacterales bacterium]|nr:GvpL/GvpF family gas vesicle protein [Solirubrobacterales bacterium]
MTDSAPTRELQAAVEALAAEMAPAVVAEARSDAEAKARSILAKEIARALLREAEGVMGPPGDSREPPRESRSRPRDGESALGFYLYGILRANVRITGELSGVDRRRRVFLLEGNKLAAIVSSVPLEEFGEEPLRENLNDVAWLEEKARAHEGVLEALLESTTVVPTRLCTIFHDEKQVREMMSREGPALLDALERLEGKAEWGVKVFAESGALERAAQERAGEEAEEGPISPGAAYMERRRREARARENAEEIADGWAQAIHERLAACAAEALLNPLQRRELSGHDGDMLLNGVYLVGEEEVDRFREVSSELGEESRARGLVVELTGPLPAYNFVKNSIEAAR